MRLSNRLTITALAAATMLAQAASGAGKGEQVWINGRVMTADVRSIGGKAYVPLEDVARALGVTVSRKAGGYALVAAGGANQLTGKARGKLGDDIFTGQWRFMVRSVSSDQQYASRYLANKETWKPKSGADKLVIVTCRLKNGRTEKELVHMTSAFATGWHTALTDEQGHSYEPMSWDAHYDYYNWACYVLPGAAVDFALVFSVPADAKPNGLVFTISRYDDRGDPKKHTDVRVSLR